MELLPIWKCYDHTNRRQNMSRTNSVNANSEDVKQLFVRHRPCIPHDEAMRHAALISLSLLAACASEPKPDARVPPAFVKIERDCLQKPMSVPRERQAVLCSCMVRELRKLTVEDIMAVSARQKEAES